VNPPCPLQIAERPNSRDARAQLIVDDEYSRHRRSSNAGLVEGEIVRVGTAADGPRAHAIRSPPDRLKCSARRPRPDYRDFKSNTFGIQTDADALAFENVARSRGNVLVLALDKSRTFFDDRGLRLPEAPVHLGELEADVAPAHDHEMLGQRIQVEPWMMLVR